MRFLCTTFLLIAASSFSIAQSPAPADGSAATAKAGGKTDTQTATSSATPGTETTIAAVRAVVVLDGYLSSNDTQAGKSFKAKLKEAAKLPDGRVLPKGTPLHGQVSLTSKHSKSLPNGAMVLTFDEATPKLGDPVPLLVKIEGLASSGIPNTTTLPVKTGMVALAANSGGGAQLRAQANDRSDLKGKYNSTGLKDVYLQASTQGSGVVFALGEDVYLDDGVQITVIMAPAPAKSN